MILSEFLCFQLVALCLGAVGLATFPALLGWVALCVVFSHMGYLKD
jgi:hypothetical protein